MKRRSSNRIQKIVRDHALYNDVYRKKFGWGRGDIKLHRRKALTDKSFASYFISTNASLFDVQVYGSFIGKKIYNLSTRFGVFNYHEYFGVFLKHIIFENNIQEYFRRQNSGKIYDIYIINKKYDDINYILKSNNHDTMLQLRKVIFKNFKIDKSQQKYLNILNNTKTYSLLFKEVYFLNINLLMESLSDIFEDTDFYAYLHDTTSRATPNFSH